MNTIEKLKKIYEVLDKKLGEDIVILKIEGISTITDYFVIVSAPSERQVKALEEALDYELEKEGVTARAVEGRSTAKWILIDYTDIIVHIFKNDECDLYNFYLFWKDSLWIYVNDL